MSVYGADKRHHTLTILGREQVRCARPGRGPLLSARLQHLQPRGRADRRRAAQPDHHRGRRGVGPLDQIINQLYKLVPVVAITELDPAISRERELLLATVEAGPEARGQVIQLVGVFEGKIVDVGLDRLTVMLAGAPSKLDDFEELIRGYGIVDMQRTGRVALPMLDRADRGSPPLHSVDQTKAG